MRGGDLSVTVHLEDEGRRRRFAAEDLPVALGGPESPVPVPGSAAPLAWLGISENEVFVQPVGAASVLCNGVPLTASHWLRDGDVLRLGPVVLETTRRGDGIHLRVERLADLNPTEPPVVLVPPPREAPGAGTDDSPGPAITPIAFTPGRPAPTPAVSLRRRLPRILAGAAVVVAIGVVAFLATARTLVVTVEPAPDRLALRGTIPALRLGSRFLATPGRYTLVAEKEGHRRLEAPVEVAEGAPRTLRFTLERLPGRLRVVTGDVRGAEILVDGVLAGTTPAPPLPVPAGEHEVVVRAEGYVEFRTRLEIEGRGVEQGLDVVLAPNSAPVRFDSVPSGATVRVDGRPLGQTPLTIPVSAGKRAVQLALGGFKPASRTIEVEAGEPLTLPTVTLVPADGVLALASEPPGASVTVNGQWRGETPVELVFPPRRPLHIRVVKAAHEEAALDVELRPGERREETLRLAPQTGEVTVEARPPDAELLVDGEPRGRASQTLELPAVPHRIEIRRDGFLPHTQMVTPRPGFPQAVRVALESEEQARAEAMPPRVRTGEGHELRLVEGMRIEMGASRREPGRRANEPLRDVELVRPFYVATTEVSNAQFRRFFPGHSSGRAGDQSLDIDTHPVVRIGWEQAAAYCNWLSEKDGLPPAYVRRGGSLVPTVPLTTGYRLPTEAEWERVARYPDGKGPLRYPWGVALPVPPRFDNYADASAGGILQRTLPGFDDGFPATAPVDSLSPNALGLYHLGGNVAEWVHDFYMITPSLSGQLVRDPTGPPEGEYHVIRGASWMHATVTELRLSYRDYGKDPRPDVGFRIARYAE